MINVAILLFLFFATNLITTEDQKPLLNHKKQQQSYILSDDLINHILLFLSPASTIHNQLARVITINETVAHLIAQSFFDSISYRPFLLTESIIPLFFATCRKKETQNKIAHALLKIVIKNYSTGLKIDVSNSQALLHALPIQPCVKILPAQKDFITFPTLQSAITPQESAALAYLALKIIPLPETETYYSKISLPPSIITLLPEPTRGDILHLENVSFV